MKKNVILISFSLILLMITFSCKKDFSNNSTNNKQNYLRQDNNNDWVQIDIGKYQYIDRNGQEQEMLVFKSDNDYLS